MSKRKEKNFLRQQAHQMALKRLTDLSPAIKREYKGLLTSVRREHPEFSDHEVMRTARGLLRVNHPQEFHDLYNGEKEKRGLPVTKAPRDWDDMAAQAVALWKKGEAVPDIAKKLHVSYGFVYKKIKTIRKKAND